MEANREVALSEFLLLGTDAEGEIFELTALTAKVCGSPAALVLLNHHHTLQIKTSIGIHESEVAQRTDFYRMVATHHDYFEVYDSEFSHPNQAAAPHDKQVHKFYAGSPLISTEGKQIGVLCAIFPEVTEMRQHQKNALQTFSRQIMHTVELFHDRELLKLEKKRYEDKMRLLQNENRILTQIIDHVPHPVFVKDIHGKYLLVNKAQSDLLGVPREGLIGKDDSHFIKDTLEYQQIQQSDSQLLLGENPIVLPEQEITLPDGSKRIVHTTKVPLPDMLGEKSILGISVDLTELRALEKDKKQMEEAYKKLVELSPDAIFIHDREKLLFANPAAVEMLGGKQASELIGRSLYEFVPVENHTIFRETISLSCDKVVFAEAEFISLKGDLLFAEVVAATFVHDQHPVKQIIVRDITQKKKFQEDLYQSKEEFKALAENSTDYICRISKELKYLYINRPISKEKLPIDYYLGKTPREVGFPDSMCEMMENNMKEILATGLPVSTYFEFPGVVGTKFHFNHMTSVPEFDQDGNIVSALISVRDITELKQNEIKLQQTNKELDRFVYSASHELRAPLKSILGLTQIALNDFNSNNHEFQELYLKTIGGSIMRLDKLVNDIIDYSRNSRLDLNLQKINLEKLVHTILHDLQYMETAPIQKSINLRLDVPFYSDESRLIIILTNIISNVFKYADKQKSSQHMFLNFQTFQDKCILEIEDNGIGIAEEHLDKICNMFFRAISSGESAGLGMYIVKETLDKLKGKMEIYSTILQGTLFRITIPNNANPLGEEPVAFIS